MNEGKVAGEATLRVLLAEGIGPVTLRHLRACFGRDEAIAGASVLDLHRMAGFSPPHATTVARAISRADVAREKRLQEETGTHLVLEGEEDFPVLLRDLRDAPCALWIRGDRRALGTRAIALVGSRRCSPYGMDQAARFAGVLAEAGFIIVSGGARGIDGAAHRAALRVRGQTLAVLGTGVNVPYPPEHADLFDEIARTEGCAVVSERPLGAAPRAGCFPRRNRLLSGLSRGVLVIEAGERSGALITARWAAEDHGREVMALPGRADSPAARGSLKLLQAGGAAMVIDPSDVIEIIAATSRSIPSQ